MIRKSAVCDNDQSTQEIGEIEDVRLTWIKPSPENNELYKPVSGHDQSIQDLARSIRDNGLLEPILISQDNYIVSGHRRYAACRGIRLEWVKVRRLPIWHDDDPDEFVKLLREHNRQRVKSLDEQIREGVVDANPDEAMSEIIEYRREKSKVGHDPLSMGNVKTRKKISPAKQEFVDAIVSVVNDRKDFWPMSDRQVHYGLLNDPPLKHSEKPDSRYRNDIQSYKSLVELITRLRILGKIPMHAIGDETRPVTNWNVFSHAGEFVTEEINDFLKGYSRNLIQSQPNHIEVVVEKNTVAGIIRPVCGEFCIPMTSGRGYCSLPPRADMRQRYLRSGKEKLIVLFVTDFDGDGEEIAASFSRSMRDDFNIDSLHPIKVCLTSDQVREYKLPPSMTAKESSSRTKGFVEKHGSNVWELEALAPATLQDIVRTAITSVLDLEFFSKEQQTEQKEAIRLHAIRVAIQESMADVEIDTDSDD